MINNFLFDKSGILFGDCLEKMKLIPDGSVDFICCDLPYGVTNNKVDIVIPFEPLWEQYYRILKPNGVIALYAQGLFYVDLVNSNRKHFRYDLVWDKVLISGFLDAKRKPLRQHEQIAIFQRFPRKTTYNPQMSNGKPLHSKGKSYVNKEHKNENYGHFKLTDDRRAGSTEKYPTTILRFRKPHPSKSQHRTEKSVECNEWLVRTYTNEGEVVLDNTSGSGTLAEACINTNRNFIIIDKDPIDFEKGKKRVERLFEQRNLDITPLLQYGITDQV